MDLPIFSLILVFPRTQTLTTVPAVAARIWDSRLFSR